MIKRISLFFRKNIATALLSAITISVVLNVGGQIISTLTKVERILERDSLAFLILEAEMAHIRSPEEVDEKIHEWRKKDKLVRLTALKSVAESDTDKSKLRDVVFSMEVYKAIMGNAIFR